ncbi:DUF4238 domain-containing protein [Burkholderia lata]|uniref:DUF4238 domain-containing protein n=1 Tax=Burkholderia lata (strain ATCC 17760 / DSM 23089 / LMG 22485 / NCIMB 9086 / R18194 / 383) TaxID=482957 RepID=UPI0015831C90|nr:DUF4238 domain-containing protein [Burkholderia lata]
MADKKKQHYVPQFYLRNFSWGEKRLPIKLFNIHRGEYFTAGNLKGQCYEDYFYGKDLVIEKMFETLEGRVSPIIDRITGGGVPPVRYSVDHDALLTFVLFQYGRTKHAGEAADEQVDRFAKAVLAKDERIEPEHLDAVKISLKNPFALTLKAVSHSVPLVHDLGIKVAVNRTPIRFVTSDHPVVFYNQYAEEREIRSNTGFASRGLQIFYPVSPYHMVVLYDEAIYKIGGRKATSVDVTSVTDVQQLNDLQWLNALENVYFDNTQPLNEIDRGSQRNTLRRNREKTIVKESEPTVGADGRVSSIVMVAKPEPKVGLRLEFLKCLKAMPDEERTFGGLLVRDPDRVAIHQEFLKAVDKGGYKASEFGRFVLDHQAARSRATPYGTTTR